MKYILIIRDFDDKEIIKFETYTLEECKAIYQQKYTSYSYSLYEYKDINLWEK